MLNFSIRSEKVSDITYIHQLVSAAFGQADEANLVNALRDHGALLFSLVAVEETTKKLLAHLAVSPVVFENQQENRSWQALGIAPLSVLPEAQGKGLGKALMNFWLEEYADPMYNALVILGDPAYYQQFGFECAAKHGFFWEKECPKEAFQIRELKKGFLSKASGKVFYHPAFDAL